MAPLLIVGLRSDPETVLTHLGSAPPLAVVAGVAMLLTRDLLADAERWRGLLRASGYGVPRRSITQLLAITSPAKALLPFKAGDGVRVLLLQDRHSVPLAVGASTRVGSALLHVAAVVVAGLVAPGGLGALLAVGCLATAAGAAIEHWGRAGAGTATVAAAGSVALDLATYAVVLAGFGVPLTGAVLAGSVLVIAASTLAVVARGLGIREATLVGLATAGGHSADAALAAGLTLSALEIGAVLVAGVVGVLLGPAAQPQVPPHSDA